ncbi:TPA: acyltransferase family protein [Raoultella planticola]|jgi:peptidoglycan/LPS O-acetylase OafA/YrhL
MKISGQINSIQILRGIAAFVVLLSHANHKTMQLGLQDTNLFSWGGIGVDIFFIISGFIMMLVTNKNSSKLQFISNRIIRIIPAYWTVSFLALGVYLIAPSLVNSSGGQTGIIQSFTLIKIPFDIKFLVQNGWTLTFEFFFYLTFIFFINRSGAQKVFFTFLLFLFIDVIFLFSSEGTRSFLNDSIKYEFIFGAALFLIYTGSLNEKIVGLLLITLASFAAKLLSASVAVRTIEFGLPALLFVGGLISIERLLLQCKDKIKHSLFLGEISYSLYLIHPFVIQTVAIITKKIKFLQYAPLFYFLVIIFSIIASNIFYHLIEKKLTTKIRDISVSKSRLKSGVD